MPIRADLRHLYGREWRLVTRPRILARAGDRCEQCGKPNNAAVTVVSLPVSQFWLVAPGTWRRCIDGREFSSIKLVTAAAIHWQPYVVRVVLTVAHLNHQAGDDRPENLKALCQWCHLYLDAFHHHLTRAARKDAARPLLNTGPRKEANL